jgi:ABC-type molybdenum transport system ATPase subunit/photorepair protein PhrA
LLAEALGPINERLARSSSIADWLRVGIQADMTIAADGGRPYALLSESEKWRADAMIAEAIAHLSGIRVLTLDRFDVLDLKGREDLLYWLDELADNEAIDTALVTGTMKGLPARLPERIEAHWIENGVCGKKLREAA